MCVAAWLRLHAYCAIQQTNHWHTGEPTASPSTFSIKIDMDAHTDAHIYARNTRALARTPNTSSTHRRRECKRAPPENCRTACIISIGAGSLPPPHNHACTEKKIPSERKTASLTHTHTHSWQAQRTEIDDEYSALNGGECVQTCGE